MNKATDSALTFSMRPMTASDLTILMELERKIFPDPWPRSAFEDILTDDDWGGLVAESEGEVVGYASWLVIDIESHLTNIAVPEAFRRKSVAKRLLERILEVVQKAGAEYILLEVRQSNGAAIAFYETYGFTLLQRRPRYYRNPSEDALVMIRYFEDKEMDK